MKQYKTQTLALIGALGLAMLAACDDGGPQKPGGAADTPPPPPPIETPPEDETPEIAYAYSPIGKRDPFKSLFEELDKQEGEQELTELQRFDIDQLRIIGIVTGQATPYAMVEDPAYKGHTINRGTLIGKNWGRVSKITQRCVTVKEEYRDYTGRKHANEIDMCLPQPPALKLD